MQANRWMAYVAGAVACVLAPGSVSAQEPEAISEKGGRWFVNGCNTAIFQKEHPRAPNYSFHSVIAARTCIEVLNTMYFFKDEIGLCSPEDIGPLDYARVVVKHLENDPISDNESFEYRFLAVNVLQKTWPCKK
jgi:hypothetical protein